jgi:hypothetical protein
MWKHAALASALLFASASGWAQEADDDTPEAAPREPAARPGERTPGPQSAANPMQLNPGEAYKGVAPGAPNLPPHPPKMPVRKGPQRLTWSGFQLKDGVPTVFLELTGPPDYEIQDTPKGIVVTLKNTVAPLKNNRRPLRLRYFNTAVKDVEAKGHGKNLRVTIRTDGRITHKEHVEPAAGGFQMLLIEIGEKS